MKTNEFDFDFDIDNIQSLSSTSSKKHVVKPIVSTKIKNAVENILVQFANPAKWKAWGLSTLRDQGAAVLLYGPPGTGKTVLANWMASTIKRRLKVCTIADFMGSSPGEVERNIRSYFLEAKEEQTPPVIFIDECDSILRDRRDISGEALTWMVGTCEALMLGISEYPSLVILASNHVDNIDPALDRRLLGKILVDRPDESTRLLLWKNKLPKKFPLKLKPEDFAELAKIDLTGAEIENAIINCASESIRNNKLPTKAQLVRWAKVASPVGDRN